MNTFVKTLEVEQNKPRPTTTENGAKAWDKTGDRVLDYFSRIGALRGNTAEACRLFIQAISENEELAIRALLWTRDIRQGAGERKNFREICTMLSARDVDLAIRVATRIPDLGRWDDLLVFVDTPVEPYAFGLIKQGLMNGNALCAKWMPRKGPKAEKLRKYLNLSPKQYRKTLVGLTDVVETKMCNKEWNKIDFEKLPSVAQSMYQKAFMRNCESNYRAFLSSLTKGEAKVNAGAIYPHTVIKPLLGRYYTGRYSSADAQLANAQWEALPNFVPEDSSVIPMIDTSGSMYCSAGGSSSVQCVDVAVGLGAYLSTKNTGAFKDVWLNFSTSPKLNVLKGKTISEKLRSIDWNDWGGSTNVDAAFGLILKHAVKHKISQEEMPQTLVIFSDMQFNMAVRGKTNHKAAKQAFKDAGYKLPKVVYWNLRATGNSPVKASTNNTALVSGFSPSLMKNVLNNNLEKYTPLNIMLDVLMDDRYSY